MPAIRYYNKEGKRLPSYSTVTNKDVDGLLYWAYDIGVQHGTSAERFRHNEIEEEDIAPDFHEARGKAANAGSLVHEMVEAYVKGKAHTDPLDRYSDDLHAPALKGFEGFERWMDSMKIEIDQSEISLVSEEYRYGGTLDALGIANGQRLILLDWKTGGRYPEHIVQVACYTQLANENGHGPIEDWAIAYFGKEYGEFTYANLVEDQIKVGWASFLHQRALYDLKKQLKKMAR